MTFFSKSNKRVYLLISFIIIALLIRQHQQLIRIRTDFARTITMTSWELIDNVNFIKQFLEDESSDDEFKVLHTVVKSSKSLSKINYNITMHSLFSKMDTSLNSYFHQRISKDQLINQLKKYISKVEEEGELIYHSDPGYYYNKLYKSNRF